MMAKLKNIKDRMKQDETKIKEEIKNTNEHRIMERHNWRKWKDEEKGKLMEMEQGITPLRMVGGSKMSGEKPPFEVHYSQDKT